MTFREQDLSWAVNEFADAELNDVRLTQRLVEIATVLAQQPQASFPQACGNPAMLKATSRFFDNPGVDPNAILERHLDATSSRIEAVPLVLAVQDTTEHTLSHHPATTDLGPLSGKQQQGMMVHTTLAITPERVALGLIAQQVWTRDPQETGKRATRKQRPITQKESQKWMKSLSGVIELSFSYPETHFVSVADREADIYDVFAMARPLNVDWLIRASRRVEHEEKYLWSKVSAQPLVATLTLDIPRRGLVAARQATVSVRFCAVTLRPPKHRLQEHLPMLTVWAVDAVEASPPDGVEPVEWLLLSSREVTPVTDALQQLDWYTCRWGIEMLHKILKSGCQIEKRQLETADRLRRCIPIFSGVAWRILYATMLSRALPDAPCPAILDAEEWQALYCRIHYTATVPDEMPPLRQAVRWLAQLGGFLGRPSDGEPAVTVLWKGFMALTHLTAMYRILRSPATQ